MKKIFVTIVGIVLFIVSQNSYAVISGVLMASEQNVLVVKMAKIKGEPVLFLYQSNNKARCRPAFQPGSVFSERPAIIEENNMTKVTITLLAGEVCGDEAKLQPISELGIPSGGDSGFISYHFLRDLIKNIAVYDKQVADYLTNHKGVLESENVEITFLYQYFAPSAYDSNLTGFRVPFYNLTEEFELFHSSPLTCSTCKNEK